MKQEIKNTLRNTKNGNRYVITYTSQGEEKSLIAYIQPYAQSKQGKNALATRGEIKESNYIPADGYGDGVMTLKSSPESGLYFTFQKQIRNEKGQFEAREIRTMKVENMIELTQTA